MLIHLLIIIKNNLRANLLLMAGMFVIATSLWYAVDYVYAVVVNQQKSLGFDWDMYIMYKRPSYPMKAWSVTQQVGLMMK